MLISAPLLKMNTLNDITAKAPIPVSWTINYVTLGWVRLGKRNQVWQGGWVGKKLPFSAWCNCVMASSTVQVQLFAWVHKLVIPNTVSEWIQVISSYQMELNYYVCCHGSCITLLFHFFLSSSSAAMSWTVWKEEWNSQLPCLRVGHAGSLVDLAPFFRRVADSNSALAAT